MLKLSDNPPPLSTLVENIDALTGTWWIARTRSRAEKALAWDLLRTDTGYYLPLVQKITFSGGRKRKVLMPLFSGYLFLCGDENARQRALATGRVAQLLPVKLQARLVTELSSIERALRLNATLELYPFATIGRRCRVVAGPFMGIEGTIVRRAERSRLILQVSMLGQGAALEVDLALLEPVDDGPADSYRSAS